MKILFSLIIATVYGLAIRLLFGAMDNVMEVMSLSFFVLVPFVIGYLTIYFIPYKNTQTSAGAFFMPWVSCFIILIITLLFNIEGFICWAMAYPLFASMAGIAGIVAFRRKKRRHPETVEFDFEKNDGEETGGLKLSFLLIIPLLAGALEGERTTIEKEMWVEAQIVIDASAEKVWSNLLPATNQPLPKQTNSISNMFGFPKHLYNSVNEPRVAGIRLAQYDKGLVFTETITKIEPNRLLILAIKNDPTSISRAVMDEHIAIGGKHVKLLEDEYHLQLLSNGKLQIKLKSHFMINTAFNWYAAVWARVLMKDVLQEELQAVKLLSEGNKSKF